MEQQPPQQQPGADPPTTVPDGMPVPVPLDTVFELAAPPPTTPLVDPAVPADPPPPAPQGAAAGAAGAQAGQGAAETKPVGYPGTWEAEAAKTGGIVITPKMYQPPGGGGYPGYPGGGYPPYPPQQPQQPYGQPAAPGAAAYPSIHPQQPQAPQQAPLPPQPAAAQQQQDSVPRPVPPAAGKKKAVIVGINYYGTQMQLRGCINDSKCIEYLLKSKFGFQQENILMMNDEMQDPLRRPTRYNMWQGFRWLMMDLRPGDSLVFHYSGHGGQQRVYSGEESDGKNETLCPLDFQSAGELVDNDINHVLVNPLPQGVKLHAIIDACHSGTAMDLPFSASCVGGYAHWVSEYMHPALAQRKGTAGGFCVQFGAARDSQTAADTSALSGNVSTGAATYAFIQAIESRGTQLSYGDLLMQMASTLHAATGRQQQSAGGLLGALLGAPTNYRGQEPVLSANYAFDLNARFSL